MKKKVMLITTMICIMVLFALIPAYAANYDENESNDAKQIANSIRIGDIIYGVTDRFDYFEGISGEDWFRFTAPVSGTAIATIYADGGTTRDNERVSLDVYDSNNNKITTVEDGLATDSGTSVAFGVMSGNTYYIRTQGSYYGFLVPNISYHFNIAYSIGPTTIKSVKGKKKAFVIKWNKKENASLYEIQYVKNKDYKNYGWNAAKTIQVSGNKKTKTIKKLSRKKYYHVRLRVARTIDGVTYYSPWSQKKKVKIK